MSGFASPLRPLRKLFARKSLRLRSCVVTALRKLLQHTSSYFAGRLIMMLAGLISLPITTRLLSKEDYGIMSLIFLVITITTAFAALGFPQATTRYFSERASQGVDSLRRFCATMIYGGLAAGTGATLLVFLASLILAGTASFSDMAVHLKYAVILILLRIVNSVCLQILRGNQQTLAYNLFSIFGRYTTIGVIVLLLFFVYPDVTAVFIGTIYVEALFLVLALAFLYRRNLIGIASADYPAVRRAISFGMPLVIADLMVSLVASSDRFVIQYYLGADSVAVYSVAYDISDYVAMMFASPLELAILPIAYTMWADAGKKATAEFLEVSINLTYVLLIPMIAGFAIVGPDLVMTIASDKYFDSGQLVPYIAVGVFLGSVNFLLLTGLLLYEKTKVVTALNGTAAVLNIIVNIILIRSFGVIGAAYATIITFVYLAIASYIASSRYLHVPLNAVLLLKSTLATAIMVLSIFAIGDVTGLKNPDLAIRIVVGVAVYFAVLMLVEPRVRDLVGVATAKIRAFSGGLR